MARSPARRPDLLAPAKPRGVIPGGGRVTEGRLLELPSPCDHQTAIDVICEVSHPLYVDIHQRRRWLESHAEKQPTGERKLAAVKDAASTIGFRFE